MKRVTRFFLRSTISFILFLLLLFLVLLGFGRSASQPGSANLLKDGETLLFVHRGLIGDYPENSREAFDKCITLGFTAVETDVRRTSDWKLVIFHDASCRRMLGIDSLLNQLAYTEVRDILLYDRLKGERGGQPGSHPALANRGILTLDELLGTYSDKLLLYLDLKEYDRRSTDSIIAQIRMHNAFERVVVASTGILTLSRIRHKEPRIRTVLEGFNAGKGWLFYFIPQSLKPSYYSSYLSRVNERHMEFLRRKDIAQRCVVYGVDSSNIKQAISLGIPHLILDYVPSLGSASHLEQQLRQGFRNRKNKNNQ